MTNTLKVLAFTAAVVIAAFLGSVTPSNAASVYVTGLIETLSASE